EPELFGEGAKHRDVSPVDDGEMVIAKGRTAACPNREAARSMPRLLQVHTPHCERIGRVPHKPGANRRLPRANGAEPILA
ncbi:MAG: hypothetical protein EBU09_11650, partial [Betaproteobacteria bacterium]|nr:hypothetical protein [Betaproteobacteria bacterium]